MAKTTIDDKIALKREILTRANTIDVEKYLIKVSQTVEVLNAYKDLATAILDSRVAINGGDDSILTLLRRTAETRAEIRPELMSDGQVNVAIKFAHGQVDAGQWIKFLTVSNAKKLFDKDEVAGIVYNKPVKAQFKPRED